MIKTDASQFWKFIKNKKRNGIDIPFSMFWGEEMANNGSEVTNLFTSFFKSIYATDSDSTLSAPVTQAEEKSTYQDVNLSKFNVRFDDVFEQLRKLDAKKGAGSDGVPSLFLKSCAAGLTEPITHIFSKSLESGIFPSD